MLESFEYHSVAEEILDFEMKDPKVLQKNSLVPMRTIIGENGLPFQPFVNQYR